MSDVFSGGLREIMDGGDPAPRKGFMARLETVTPERAEWILSRKDPNRTVSEKHVAAMAEDMIGKRWRVTGQGISFDTNGNLIDGQHRLWAILESDCPAVMLVVYGCDLDAFSAIDSTRVRTYRDDLQKKKIPNASALSGLVRHIAACEESMKRKAPLVTVRLRQHSRYTLADFHAEYGQTVDLQESVRFGNRLVKRPLRISSTAAGGVHYLLSSRYGSRIVEEFGEALATGEGLYEGEPVLAFRNRALKEADERPRMSTAWYTHNLIKTFLAQQSGESWRKFQSANASAPIPQLPAEL